MCVCAVWAPRVCYAVPRASVRGPHHCLPLTSKPLQASPSLVQASCKMCMSLHASTRLYVPQVRSRVLELISSDPGVQQTELVLLGTFGRAARLITAAAEGKEASELTDAAVEARSLVELLSARHGELCTVLEAPAGGYPDLRSSVWQAPASAQAAAQALGPQMAENRKRVRGSRAKNVTFTSALLWSAYASACLFGILLYA